MRMAVGNRLPFRAALAPRRHHGWPVALAMFAALTACGLRADDAEPPPADPAKPAASAKPAATAKRPLPALEGVEPQCLFLPGTAIPMLAMGVRRLDDGPEVRDRRLLDLWERPGGAAPGAEPLDRVPLFRPLFVYGRSGDWTLLGETYAGRPLGWADGRQLQQLETRYAYHFSNPDRVKPGVHLYDSRQAAYDALAAQSQAPPQTPLDGVVVAERLEETHWDPLAPLEEEGEPHVVPPFIELRDQAAEGAGPEAGLTDTTLTFPLKGENRLVHLGAVAGGPVKMDEIARKRKDAAAREGIAIVFVIDETYSMGPHFGGVADFIEKNLELDEGNVDVKVAVCWYSDVEGKDSRPYDVRPLEPLTGPGIQPAQVDEKRRRVVKTVRDHKERIIRGWGAQAEELIYPGLVAAIEKAGFEAGENAMVFVIGDAADRSGEVERPAKGGERQAGGQLEWIAELAGLDPQRNLRGQLQEKLRQLIDKHKLQMAFIEVGEQQGGAAGSFAAQAEAFRKTLPGELQESVFVQGAGGAPLQARIADLQARMERRRRTLLAEIAEMETRNRYTQPGPALEKRFAAAGIDREAFDLGHLQFFEPAWGWLYHPQQAEATPQLRELTFVAKPESDALIPTFIAAADGLEKNGKIDMELVRGKLKETLARISKHTKVAEAIEAAWQALPEQERTLGRFLRDGMGLRVRNALLFHKGTAKATEPTRQSVQMLRRSREVIGNARKTGVTWVDSWKVLP